MKVVWHKHYLIISFLVGFAHHDKNFNETYQAQKALRGNSFLFNVITNLIWDFFQMEISLLAYEATFSGQLYFWRNYFFILLQSNNFDVAVTFSEQLFLQSSYLF